MAAMHKHITVLYIALGICLVQCARRIDVKKRMATGVEEWRARRSNQDSNPNAEDILGLGKDEGLQASDSLSTKKGSTKTKFKETYQGVEVEDEVVVIEQDQSGDLTGQATGQLVEGIEEELPSVDPEISALDALHIALAREKDDYDDITFNVDTDAKLLIRTEETADPDDVKLFLVWQINYRADSKFSRPFYVIDAMTGNILEFWQGIDNFPAREIKRKISSLFKMNDITRLSRGLKKHHEKANDRQKYSYEEEDPDCIKGYTKIGGIGGNVKNGMTVYGKDYPLLLVKKTEGICSMENDNVQVIDMRDFEPGHYYYDEPSTNYSYSPRQETRYTAHKFDCVKGNDDEVNGGYSPLNDVYYFSSEVYKMYREWFNVDPLKNMTIRAKVHNDFENAYWDGQYVSFGDGGSTFHPLTSMDVVAHEIGHGFTEHHSGLVYDGESGGMNEAFSDMAGETAEHYIGGNDWHIGKGIMVDYIALRFMDDPTKDNRSIGNSEDYCPGIDVHHSSGVFNRAFYILSNQPGWGIEKAFKAFATANMLYWTPHSNFPQGACGVVNAASDLGYDVFQVIESFRSVGVEPCRKRRQGYLAMFNIKGKAGGNATFLWTVDENIHDATISLQSRSWDRDPDVDLYVTSKDYHLVSAKVDASNEEISIPNPTPGPNHIVIQSRNNFTKIVLTVTSNKQIVEENLAYEKYHDTSKDFQMPLEISEDQISFRNTIAVRISRSANETMTSTPWSMMMRYGEEVDTEDYLYDYYGREYYDDNWNWEYTEIIMCVPQSGTWYLALTGSFRGIDVSVLTVHFPLKLQEPGEKEVKGKTCW